MEARHTAVALFDDAKPCLRELAGQTFRLGLVTNGNSSPSRLGIGSLFELTVVAADCGLRKPDPAIYQHTADNFGVPPQACVHVGDHPVEDVKAAAEASKRTVWINRDRNGTPGPDTPAWHTVTTLDELPPLLGTQPGVAVDPGPSNSGGGPPTVGGRRPQPPGPAPVGVAAAKRKPRRR